MLLDEEEPELTHATQRVPDGGLGDIGQRRDHTDGRLTTLLLDRDGDERERRGLVGRERRGDIR